MRRFLLTLCIALLPSLAMAVQPDEILPDAKQESRAREISAELRCLVCQNQSIDDSDAGLARDLRLLVRERIKAGDSNDQVREFLVQRYGDFILLKPPFKMETLLLWLTPAAVLVAGALAHARAQLAVAVTGIAGPGGAVPGKPVGTVWLAWATPQGLWAECQVFPGDRAAVREATRDHALQGLLARL